MQELLRQIPQVDELLRRPELAQAAQRYGRALVLEAVRVQLDALRAAIQTEKTDKIPAMEALADAVLVHLEQAQSLRPRRVLNATGVALHTNLGRAPLAEEACDAVQTVARGYSNLEFDLKTGERGSRNSLLEPLLCRLCGCEAALAVNNNAAALLLALATLAGGKEILVSRGELVEIGDSFRVPDIMAQSGGRLVEVGSTNKTRLRDYEQALSGHTGALLKVHTSNFRVVGFTESVPVRELASLGRAKGIPVVADLGSGALLEAAQYPFTGEPTVPELLREGADVVCFSGDKLLGGPQAGILLGGRELIGRMKRNPLARALRIDKLSLAALEATLRLYLDPERAKKSVPALRMVCANSRALRESAEGLRARLAELGPDCGLEVVPQSRPVGGGSVPGQELAGWAVAVSPWAVSAGELAARLRKAEVPLIARINGSRLLLDVSTLAEDDFLMVAREIAQAL